MADEKPDKTAQRAVDEVQKQVDADEAKGYHGAAADETPRENYTVAGVTSGAPTPENDA